MRNQLGVGVLEAEATQTFRMVAFGEYVDDGTASATKARDYKDATDLVAIHSLPIAATLTRGGSAKFDAGRRQEDDHNIVASGPIVRVRRLTPRECERLQGFPDDYTVISVGNKPAADGPRYKALGNSMAINVMRWVGQRIAMVDQLRTEIQATNQQEKESDHGC